MSGDLNTEIKMSVNAEGVESGVTRAKRSIEDLGTAVDSVGKRGEGLNQLGRDGETAGRKIDQVTKSMVSSLQRQIAAAEAGGTATRQYQESLARLRGANMNVLGPYLDQLEAAKAKTEDAERAVNGMAGSLRSLSSYIGGVAGGLAAYFSLRTFIDETIAAEQEQAQLAAVLRSTGQAAGWSREQLNEMAEALSSKGGKSLLSAGEINQAQTRLLSYANVVGEVFPRALKNAIDMAQRMGMDVKSATETIGKALDVPSEGLSALTKQGFRFTESQKALVEHLEATGRTAQAQGIILDALESSYAGAGEAARNTLGGSLKALRNTVNDLMTGEGGSINSMRQGIEDLNGALGSPGTKEAFQSFLGWIASVSAAAVTGTANLLAFMQASNKLGIITGTDSYGQIEGPLKRRAEAYGLQLEQLTARAERFQEAISRGDNVEQNRRNLEKLRESMERVRREALTATQALKDFIFDADPETVRKTWAVRNAYAAVDPRRVDLQRSAPAVPAKVDKKAAEEQRRELAEQAKLIAELAGLTGTFYADWERLNRMFREGALSVDQLTEAQGKLLAKQPAIKAENERIAKEQEAALKAALHLYQVDSKAQEQLLHQRQQLAASTEDAVRRAQDEAQAHAMAAAQGVSLADAIAQIALARAEEAYQKELSKGADAETLLALQKEVQARKELLGLIRNKAARDAAEDAAKKAAQEWERTADQINQSLTDALMRGFEDGKGFAANLRDTVVNMFKTMVLRPVVSAIVMPVAGALTGALGLAGSASAGQGGAGGIGTIASIGSMFGGSLMAGAGWMTGATSFGGALSAGGSLLGTGFAGSMSGVGMLAGALLPLILGASLLGSFDKSGTPHYGASATYEGGKVSGDEASFRANRGISGRYSASAQSGVNSVAMGAGATLDAIDRLFGGKGGFGVTTAYSDDSSDDPGFGSLRITRDGQKVTDWGDTRTSKWADKIFADGEEGARMYAAAVAKDVRDAMLGIDLPEWARNLLTDIGDEVSMEQLSQVVQQIGAIKDTFDALGATLTGFAELTDGARMAILDAAGGIDALASGAGAFYQNFYSDAERKDIAKRQLGEKLNELGVDIDLDDPKAREKYRALVEQKLAQANTEEASKAALKEQLSNSVLSNMFAGGGIEGLVGLDIAGLPPGLLGNDGVATQEQIDKLNAGIAALDTAGMSFDDIKGSVAEMLEPIVGTGKSAAETAAALLGLSGSFADVTMSAEEAAEAAKRQADEAARQVEQDRRAAHDAFRRAADRDRKDLQAQASSLSEAISGISSAVDLLKSNARDLYGEVDSTAQMLAAQGMVYVENALAGVRAGASVADYTGLSDAISAARGGLGSGVYQSEFARQRDTLVLAGQLSELGELGDLQLSVEERQLRAINEQLEYLDGLTARADELINGTVTLTGTVESYFQQLLALFDKGDGGDKKDGDNGGGGRFAIGGSGPGESAGGSGGSSGGGGETQEEEIRRYYKGIDISDAQSMRNARNTALFMGWTQEDIARAYDVDPVDLRKLFDDFGIPAFATGINRVPYDMVAQIHKDEAIVPAAFNPFNPGAQRFGGSESALLEELRALRKKVEELSLISAVTASNTAPLPVMADQFDSVTEGGNAMRGDAGNLLEL